MKWQKRRILLLFAVFVTDRNINSYSVFIITKSRTGLLPSADSVCLHLFCTPFRVRRTKEKYEGRMYDVRRIYEGKEVRRRSTKDEGREIGAVGTRNLIKNIKFLRM